MNSVIPQNTEQKSTKISDPIITHPTDISDRDTTPPTEIQSANHQHQKMKTGIMILGVVIVGFILGLSGMGSGMMFTLLFMIVFAKQFANDMIK